jgi:4-azaleucine resistance transporter AzlC
MLRDMKTSRFSVVLSGLRATLPLLPGEVPFGLIYGVAARGAGVPAPLTQGMSAIVFAGSAQFAVVQLVAAGTPVVVLVLAGIIINLRHVLYSATVAPDLRGESPRWKTLLAYLLTDELFGVFTARLRQGLPVVRRRWFALGAGLTLWVAWQLSTLGGLLVGGEIPSAWSLDFTATLTFIALVVPMLADRPALVCAGAAGLASIAALRLPLKLGLVVATLVGVLAGLLADRARTPRPTADVPNATNAPAVQRCTGEE